MAQQVLIDSQLRLVFDMGMDENGKTIFKNKNYNNVKTSSTPEQLLQAAQAIAGLQTETLALVERNNSNQIIS